MSPQFILSALSLVDGGHRAVIFDRFVGVKQTVIGEGTHFFIPWVQKPIIFDVRSRARNVPVVTGSKGGYLYRLGQALLLILFLFISNKRLAKCQHHSENPFPTFARPTS